MQDRLIYEYITTHILGVDEKVLSLMSLKNDEIFKINLKALKQKIEKFKDPKNSETSIKSTLFIV